jgi:hypothetical protein
MLTIPAPIWKRFQGYILHEKHTDNKIRGTSINLVQLSGNDTRQKKGYFE